MAYVLPQVTVFQEFNIVPAATAVPRSAHITGGHAQLFRYSVSDEKDVINLGEYDSVSDNAYEWPQRPTGSQVDFNFVKLHVEDALLEYYNNPVSAGGDVEPVSGYKNRVRDASTAFKSNGASYPRSAAMYDRDAKIGDYVSVRGSFDGTEYSLNTSIRGFVGDVVAAVVDSCEAHDPNNKGHLNEGVTGSFLTPALLNAVTVAASATGYDGLETGDPVETYTVEVISGSVDADFTTARLRVTSASGRDNQSSVTPATAGSATAIGTRGFHVTFDNHTTNSTSSIAASEGISEDNLVEGQKWQFTVTQAFCPSWPQAAGTYAGTQDTTYIIEVTKGGVYAANPEITVTTTTGYDVSGPTIIAAPSVAYAIGSYGVTLTFNHTALCKGDKYYVNVTAAKSGLLKTLILADDLPDNLLLASDLNLKLYIRKNLEVARELVADAPNVAYTTSDTEITVQSGIVLYDDSWTDAGVKLPLPLKGGTLYVEYRAWLPTYVNVLESISSTSDLSSMLGQASPDNPLYWGVYLALQNSNGQPVYFTAVSDPDATDSWDDALEGLDGQTQIYNLVPLTNNGTVQGAWKAHVEAQSAPEVGNFRAAVFGVSLPSVKAIVNQATSSDGNAVLATLADDPSTSGTQYTRLSVPANNAKFITNGVRAGDKVRFLYSTDGFGNENYSEFVIDAVLSEGTLRLATGNASSISVAQRVEIWRTLNRSDKALELIDAIGVHKSRRVVVIANDSVGLDGAVFPGYFAAAAVAGLRAGTLPQQSLTRVSVSGIDDVGVTITSLNGTQLNSIAGAGGWIIVKDATGAIYNRHGLTSDTSDVNTREETIRANVDSMSYQYKAAFEPFIGKANVTQETLSALSRTFRAISTSLSVSTGTLAGAQLIAGDISQIRQHALYKDRVVIEAILTIPYPLNNIELKLVV
jgi:hypothetical protein